MSLLALFASTFALVFFLGLQSLNVNRGHYLAAFLTSFGIGASNATAVEMAAYLTGGPFGIVASMWVHRHFTRKR